jgi:hypothetical protein
LAPPAATNRLLIDPRAVREAARRGELAAWAAAATGPERRALTKAVYEIAWPLVFTGLTRRLEIQRGHSRCAASLRGLTDDCFDRFQDDLEAVVVDVMQRATVPVACLDAWIRSRLNAATVDAHRRRRGERGALQRPRLPGWLRDALGNDRWLTMLAVEMLVWVGVPASAGTGLWPLDSWAQRRAVLTRDWRGSDASTVAREVEEVQRAMRRRPDWHESYVEGPLGRKNPPVIPAPRGDVDRVVEPAPLPLVERHETDDARLLALAALAVEAIEAGIARGEEPAAVVGTVLKVTFGADTGAQDLDRMPSASVADDERAAALAGDPAVVGRVVSTVLSIIGSDDR